jgi:MSHA biogenesis protein MshG
MPRYYYKARNSRGEAVEGYLEGNNSEAIAAQLFNNGIIPIEIAERAVQSDPMHELLEKLKAGKIEQADMIMFSRQMFTLTKAGVPIIRAMSGLAETARNPAMAKVLKSLSESLDSGRSLAEAMKQHPTVFPQIYVSLIQVGENSGRLDEAFVQVAQYMELDKNTRDRIKTATRYPMFVIIAITIAIAIINLKVIPAFKPIFKTLGEIPVPTKILLGMSDFFVDYWYVLIALVGGSVFGFRYYVNTEEGRYVWDKYKLRMPLMGNIIYRATLARFTRSFSMALRSGVPLLQALNLVSRAVGNEFVLERLMGMRNGIERGESITRTASATGLFTPLVMQMLAVGEETGQMDKMLEEVSDFYEREVDYDIKRLSSMIEPIMTMVIGVLVAVLALGVFLPLWEMAGAKHV